MGKVSTDKEGPSVMQGYKTINPNDIVVKSKDLVVTFGGIKDSKSPNKEVQAVRSLNSPNFNFKSKYAK